VPPFVNRKELLDIQRTAMLVASSCRRWVKVPVPHETLPKLPPMVTLETLAFRRETFTAPEV